MKYFKNTMYVMYDGKEFPKTYFYEANRIEEAYKQANRCASKYIDDDEAREDRNGWWFEGDSYLVYPEQDMKEISEQTYLEMTTY